MGIYPLLGIIVPALLFWGTSCNAAARKVSIRSGVIKINETEKNVVTNCPIAHVYQRKWGCRSVSCAGMVDVWVASTSRGQGVIECYRCDHGTRYLIKDLMTGFSRKINGTAFETATPYIIDDGMCSVESSNCVVASSKLSAGIWSKGGNSSCLGTSNTDYHGASAREILLIIMFEWRMEMPVGFIEQTQLERPKRSAGTTSKGYKTAVSLYKSWRFPRFMLTSGSWCSYGAADVRCKAKTMLKGTCSQLRRRGLGRMTLNGYSLIDEVDNRWDEEIAASGFMALLLQNFIRCETFFLQNINIERAKLDLADKKLRDKAQTLTNRILTNLKNKGTARDKKINELVLKSNAQGILLLKTTQSLNNVVKALLIIKKLINKNADDILKIEMNMDKMDNRVSNNEGWINWLREKVEIIATILAIDLTDDVFSPLGYEENVNKTDESINTLADVLERLINRTDKLEKEATAANRNQTKKINENTRETDNLLSELKNVTKELKNNTGNLEAGLESEKELREQLAEDTNKDYMVTKEESRSIGGLNLGKIGLGFSLFGGISFTIILIAGALFAVYWFVVRPKMQSAKVIKNLAV